jgi:hypothetical protein
MTASLDVSNKTASLDVSNKTASLDVSNKTFIGRSHQLRAVAEQHSTLKVFEICCRIQTSEQHEL